MKIYKHNPLYLIQLTFRRGTEHVIYLTLCETDISLTLALLTDLFKPGTKTDKLHRKTRIEIRERIGGKNGKFKAHSFYGDSVDKTRRKLINYINKTNQ